MPDKNELLQVRLDQTAKARLVSLAAFTGLTQSDVTRLALLEKWQRTKRQYPSIDSQPTRLTGEVPHE